MTSDSDRNPSSAPLRVLVLGAHGFIGTGIVAALRRHGMSVSSVVRGDGGHVAQDRIGVDLSRMCTPEHWLPLLQDVDAVVNAAGILRESSRHDFEAIHLAAPLALAQACRQLGIHRFVQISALGDPADGEFIASKHRFDVQLLQVLPSALVLRPSVVYATAGSYGGSSLLRALAALPCGVWLPGHGQWQLQPISLDDLAELVLRGLSGHRHGLYAVGGPEVLTLQQYQTRWRRWLRLPGHRPIRVPMALIRLQTVLADRVGGGPMGAATWRMLQRGNLLPDGALQRLQADFDLQPRTLSAVLDAQPSHVQDRWHARLYPLAPLLRLGVGALWLLSGWVGLSASATSVRALMAPLHWPQTASILLARGSGMVDVLLGLWLLGPWRPRWAVDLMLLSVLLYTAFFGILLPAQWLDPLGGLAKNLVILPALLVLRVLLERR